MILQAQLLHRFPEREFVKTRQAAVSGINISYNHKNGGFSFT